jgi:hypothetical protein
MAKLVIREKPPSEDEYEILLWFERKNNGDVGVYSKKRDLEQIEVLFTTGGVKKFPLGRNFRKE